MIAAFNDDYGVEVLHAWGMTEMSPLGTLCTLKNKHLALPPEEQMKIRLKQGRAIFGVDMKIVGDDGKELPWDGKAFGDLYVKGPWIVRDYFRAEAASPLVDGWFPTGDVATAHRPRRLHADHRPQQGRDQVGRRVDQLDRHREHRRRPTPRWPWPPASACRTPSGTSGPSWPW